MQQETPKSWLEVSLVVDEEAAEAVAEVFSRFVTGGVVIESTQVKANLLDEGHSVGPLRVYGYLPLDAQLEEKRRHLEEALWHLGQIRSLPTPQFKVIHETDWSQAWKHHYQPIAIGEHLLIVPTWLEPPESERILVRMDPGMAFGTGTHPTTQLCLEFIEEWFASRRGFPQRHPECCMIDLGCGSGILAIAALKLGAKKALAMDTDPQAVQVARQNAALNGVSDHLEVAIGSVEEILNGHFSLKEADFVVANILAPTLIQLLSEGLAQLVTPHGWLVLSGILQEQAGEVITAAQARGLHLIAQRAIEDWVALVFSCSSP